MRSYRHEPAQAARWSARALAQVALEVLTQTHRRHLAAGAASAAPPAVSFRRRLLTASPAGPHKTRSRDSLFASSSPQLLALPLSQPSALSPQPSALR